MEKEITFCKNCLMPNTRPWGEFKDGVCGACHFHEKKEHVIDWDERSDQLVSILDRTTALYEDYDVLVPISGGKDGAHVAWTMKEKYGCKVLTATLAPPMWTDLGLRNLKRFSRFTNIPNVLVTPPYNEYRALNWKGMIEMGYPKRGFVAGLVPSMMQIARKFNIPLIMWGEHEEEYEGEREVHNERMIITFEDFLESDDFCGRTPDEFNANVEGDLSFWTFPWDYHADISQCYFSRFEKWNSTKHLKTAMEKCGMLIREDSSGGTYTRTSQLDDKLYTFFMYMAFMKFGFARVTNDIGIACRQGGLEKEKAVNYLEKYESILPADVYMDAKWYFDVKPKELEDEIHKWWNKDLLDYDSGMSFVNGYNFKDKYLKLRRKIAMKG